MLKKLNDNCPKLILKVKIILSSFCIRLKNYIKLYCKFVFKIKNQFKPNSPHFQLNLN